MCNDSLSMNCFLYILYTFSVMLPRHSLHMFFIRVRGYQHSNYKSFLSHQMCSSVLKSYPYICEFSLHFVTNTLRKQEGKSYNFMVWVSESPESEKPGQRVSNADRKAFANPESFCKKFIIGWRITDTFQNKISR